MAIIVSVIKDPAEVWSKLDEIVKRVISQPDVAELEVKRAQIFTAYLSYRAQEMYVFRLKDEVREMKRLFLVTSILAAATLVLAIGTLFHF